MHCNVDFRTKLIQVWIPSNFTVKGLWATSIWEKFCKINGNQAVWQTETLFCLLYTTSHQIPFTLYAYQFRRGFSSSNNWFHRVQSFYRQHWGRATRTCTFWYYVLFSSSRRYYPHTHTCGTLLNVSNR